MSTVIKGGTIIAADRTYEADILIEGGERTAEIVYLGHGAPSSVHTHTTKMPPLAACAP